MRDADELLHALDLADAGFGRADDQVALEQLVDRRARSSPAPGSRCRSRLARSCCAGSTSRACSSAPARRPRARRRRPSSRRPRAARRRAAACAGFISSTTLLEDLPELGEPLDRHAEAAGEHVEAASHRRFDRIRALRRDPDRRTRLLHRLREDRRLGNLEELAFVAERLAFERLQDDVERLVPALAARYRAAGRSARIRSAGSRARGRCRRVRRTGCRASRSPRRSAADGAAAPR